MVSEVLIRRLERRRVKGWDAQRRTRRPGGDENDLQQYQAAFSGEERFSGTGVVFSEGQKQRWVLAAQTLAFGLPA
jgi:hypothetical protein